MQHELAELLITVQIRRIHSIQHLQQILKSLNAPSHYASTKQVFAQMEEQINNIAKAESQRIQLEFDLLKAAIQNNFKPDEYLPFEIKVEQLVSGSDLRSIFVLLQQLQDEFLTNFTQISQIINNENFCFRAVLDCFRTSLDTYLNFTQPQHSADFNNSKKLQNLHSEIFRRSCTQQIDFSLLRARYSDLELRMTKMSQFEKLNISLKEEKLKRIQFENTQNKSRKSQYRHRVESVYRQPVEPDLGKELYEIKKSVRKNVYGNYDQYIDRKIQKTKSQQVYQPQKYEQQQIQHLEFNSYTAITTNPTYHQKNSSFIYPNPPSIDQITAYATVTPPLHFNNFPGSFPSFKAEKVQPQKHHFEQQLMQLQPGTDEIEQIEALQFEENLMNFSRWKSLESGHIQSLEKIQLQQYCEIYKNNQLIIKKSNTQKQQQLLNSWGELVLQIASKRPVPDRYAPILTSCGRFTRYLDIQNGKTTNIHPEVIKAQEMISRQCLKLDQCIKVDPESQIHQFEEILRGCEGIVYLQGIKNLKGVCLVEVVETISRIIGEYEEGVMIWGVK